ncbi:hypothetical protein BGZ74_005008, partial [Mortierella antarctica]
LGPLVLSDLLMLVVPFYVLTLAHHGSFSEANVAAVDQGEDIERDNEHEQVTQNQGAELKD